MKTKLISILTLSALLYACEGSELDVIVEEEKAPVETVDKPVKKEVKEEVKVTVDDILKIYNENLNGQFQASYNEKENSFILMPINATFNKDLADMMNERLPLDEWYNIVEGLRNLSISTEEKLGGGYGHAIMNPYNPENILLLIKDGTVLLDAFEGME